MIFQQEPSLKQDYFCYQENFCLFFKINSNKIDIEEDGVTLSLKKKNSVVDD